MINAGTHLSLIQLQSIYQWCCIANISKVTFITNSSQKFDCPLIAEKKTNVSIIPTGQGMKQILGLCKEQNRVTKEVIIKDTADMLICHGKKGMQMGDIPVGFLHMAEIYLLQRMNELEFFYLLQRYSESEQRNGR